MSIQENAQLIPDSSLKHIQYLQQKFRRERAYHAISDYLKFRIEEVSKENLKNLRGELARGNATLDRCCVKKSDVNSVHLSEATDKILGVEQPSKISPLLPKEKRLLQSIMENLTLKHITRQNVDELDELVSVRERMRQGENVENCRTYKHSRDEFVYFTFGIGDHYSEYNSNPENQEIVIDVNKFLKENPNGLDGIWVSGHDSCYVNASVSNPVKLGGTTFRFSHNLDERTKTYVYERADGSRYERTINYQDEVLFGDDDVPGIAMQFIQHLRYIGGTYREHLLNTINDQTIDTKKRHKILSAGMQAIMPGWDYPEAKIPVKISLKNSAVIKHNNNQVRGKYRYVSDESDVYIAIQTHDMEKLKKYVGGGNDFAIRFTDGKTPLTLAINYVDSSRCSFFKSERELKTYPDHIIFETIQFLVSHGASVLDTDLEETTPLYHAIAAEKLSFVNYLLKQEEADPNDPMITRSPDVNAFSNPQMAPLYASLTQKKSTATPKILSSLLGAGADAKSFGAEYLALASMKKGASWTNASVSEQLIRLLIVHGAVASKPLQNGNSPLLCCVANSEDHKKDSLRAAELLLEHGADVNYQFSPSLPNLEAGYTALHLAVQHNHVEMVYLLLKYRANPNLPSLNKMTPLLLAQKNGSKAIETILLKHGAHTQDMTHEHIIPLHKYCVMLVITGKDKYGEEVVVMGHKRDEDGQINKKLLLPGGYKDFSDVTFDDAAIREAEEETNLKLKEKYIQGELKPCLIHSQEMVGHDREKFIKICCYHIDIGDDLANIRLVGRDDLIELSAPRLSNFDPKTKTFNKKPVRHSNAIVIANLKNENLSWLEDLEESLSIENLGIASLEKAFKEKDEKKALRILQNPSFDDIAERADYEVLLKLLGHHATSEISDLLSTHISSRKYEWYEISKIRTLGALYGHKKLCEWFLSDHKLTINQLLELFSKASEGGHTDLASMFQIEATKESRRHEWQKEFESGEDDNLGEVLAEFPPILELFLNLMIVAGAEGGKQNVIDDVCSKITLCRSVLKKVAYTLGKKGNIQLVDHFTKKFENEPEKKKLIGRKVLLGAVRGFHVDPIKEEIFGGQSNVPLELIEQYLKKGIDVYDFPFDQCSNKLPFNPVVDKIKGWAGLACSEKSPIDVAAHQNDANLLKMILESSTNSPFEEEFFSKSTILLSSLHKLGANTSKFIVEDGRINLDLMHSGKTALIHALQFYNSDWHKHEPGMVVGMIAKMHIKQAISTILERTVDLEVSGLKLTIKDKLTITELKKLKGVLGGEIPNELTVEHIRSLLECRHEQYKDLRYAKIVFDTLRKAN
ncbi:MAG: ankyrin repeat domain-containing protein [Chlamydiota bacterium]